MRSVFILAALAALTASPLLEAVTTTTTTTVTVTSSQVGFGRRIEVFDNSTSSTGTNTGVTFVVTEYVKTQTGTTFSFQFNRTWFNIGENPCPHVAGRKDIGNGTANLQSGTSLTGLLGSYTYNAQFQSSSHYFVLGQLYLYDETDGVVGMQRSELVTGFSLCNANGGIFWETGVVRSNYTSGTAIVHQFKKCANITAAASAGLTTLLAVKYPGVSASTIVLGQLCFTFSISNESYVLNGVNRNAGEIKIDKAFMPSQLFQVAGLDSHMMGVAGMYFTSSDSVNVNSTFTASSTVTSSTDNTATVTTTTSFSPNLAVSFSSGAVSYLSWDKTVTVTYNNQSTAKWNVNVQTYTTADFATAFGITINGATFTSDNQVSQSIVLFDFLGSMKNVQQVFWDPADGYATSTTTSTTTSAAVHLVLPAGIIALLMTFLVSILL
jgi:hypothetical protein